MSVESKTTFDCPEGARFVYALIQRGEEFVLSEAFVDDDGAVLTHGEPAAFVGSREDILKALNTASSDVYWAAVTLTPNEPGDV